MDSSATTPSSVQTSLATSLWNRHHWTLLMTLRTTRCAAHSSGVRKTSSTTHNKFTIKCNFSLFVVLSYRSSTCLFFHRNDEHGISMTVICTNICFISIHNKMGAEFFQLFKMTTHNTITPLAWNKKRCLLFLLYFCQSIYYSLYFFLFLSFSYSFFYSFSFPLILFFMNRLFLMVICVNKWECAFQYFIEKNTDYCCT